MATKLTSRSIVLIATAGLMMFAASANADDITFGAFNVSPTPVYEVLSPPPNLDGLWDVKGADGLGALMTNGTVGKLGQVWNIAPSFVGAPPARFNWEAPLDQDLNPGGPLANGLFSTGTMTIEGKLYNEFYVEIYDGLLLEADVSAFEMLESDTNLNQMNLEGIATITPTGGFLVTNGLGLNLVGDYYLDVTVATAQQNGSGLVDFSAGDVMSVASMQVSLAQVPEPASLIPLLGGLGLFVGRRR